MDTLEVCKQTRKFAAQSLYTVLKKLVQSDRPISEVMLRDAWLEEMQKNKSIFPNGWYDPPPHGMIILFGTDKHVERLNYKSARPKEKWPRDDIFLDTNNGIAYMYASPVDRNSGIIGDFGLTLYFGKDPEIKALIKAFFQINNDIFTYTKTGMKLSDTAVYAEKLLNSYGMVNEIVSITDKAVVNIGHTIPFYNGLNKQEHLTLQKGDNYWEKLKDMISNKRIFVNGIETTLIKPPISFTIEPRGKVINKPHLPTSLGYHTIALFKENGEKELLTDFDDLFTLAGMDYMF